jgi:hypothetical protein
MLELSIHKSMTIFRIKIKKTLNKLKVLRKLKNNNYKIKLIFKK